MPKRFVVAASEFPDLPRFPVGFELAEALTVASQQLHEAPTPHGTLRTAARLAVHILPGAEHAGVSEIDRGNKIRTLAWTDEVVRAAEARHGGREQHGHWEQLWHSPVARITDSEADGGWDVLAALGLRSALSLRLRTDRRRLTVLTAYARKPGAFDEAATRIGRLFTAHVSIALDSVSVREQLTEAMHTRDLIGQATGILMERQGIDAAAAFESLVRASQRENVKLRDIARRIVDTHNTS
ncbi:response regulator receiver/ANTAR domain-containing protein [Streptomyces viridochromogenes DSM 40736]|uniref:Response regulator receiver/ANTAR domain-containing protein n=1 Tax=Streptomyces viridochromogenes (strain DSM 40736 / JCM 4977 / BCRC 1201 / Tue 494) TaxID=591159 RepID=D9WYY8_STRVT|nr:ANTAR domain-containing protein [Streptomyces viridochromogenes]EFL33267.1 response regulator receiver/ANTAR domain-containing protein [Streptomyces viridochromogenes DSM 40736]